LPCPPPNARVCPAGCARLCQAVPGCVLTLAKEMSSKSTSRVAFGGTVPSSTLCTAPCVSLCLLGFYAVAGCAWLCADLGKGDELQVDLQSGVGGKAPSSRVAPLLRMRTGAQWSPGPSRPSSSSSPPCPAPGSLALYDSQGNARQQQELKVSERQSSCLLQPQDQLLWKIPRTSQSSTQRGKAARGQVQSLSPFFTPRRPPCPAQGSLALDHPEHKPSYTHSGKAATPRVEGSKRPSLCPYRVCPLFNKKC